MPGFHEVLEQVAVVARELDDEAARLQAEPLVSSAPRSTRACSTQLAEYEEKYAYSEKICSGGTYAGKLHEPAAVAHTHVERIEWLHLLEPAGGDEALAER